MTSIVDFPTQILLTLLAFIVFPWVLFTTTDMKFQFTPKQSVMMNNNMVSKILVDVAIRCASQWFILT